jgi:hypothetical protein
VCHPPTLFYQLTTQTPSTLVVKVKAIPLLLLLVRNLMKADWLCLISWGEELNIIGGCGSWPANPDEFSYIVNEQQREGCLSMGV